MDQRDTIRKEVLGALKEGEQDGSIREMEYRMIRNVFSFMDQDAKDVMTHRKNIVALNCDDTLEEAAAFASKAKNSRFPVYEEEIDNILGIVHIRDIMKFYLDPDMREKVKGDRGRTYACGLYSGDEKDQPTFYADESQPEPSLCGDR